MIGPMKSIIRITCCALVTFISMSACAADGASSEAELQQLYQGYFQQIKSVAQAEPKVPESSEAWRRMATLVYWQGVEQRERDAFFRSLRDDINYRLQKLEFVPLDAGAKLAYTLDGVTYVPALPAIGRMVVRYKDQGNATHLATSYLVGVKNGKYYIDLATPKRSH